jgi:methionyl-tRNA formyltransferase
MKDLRIVFMGTPDFAVATLGCLIMNGFNVVAVVTAPDKPAGRGRKLKKSAVKEFAEFSSLPVLQPESLKDPVFIDELMRLEPDLAIVVAFRMLPEVIWRIPKSGTINLHASLLPNYRGAAPINHAIINGETVTGVTTFFIDEKIDTGSILLREEVPIFAYDNAGDLHDRLKLNGARLVIKTIEGIATGNLKPKSQEEFVKTGNILRPAPKLSPEFCIIDWKKDVLSVNNFIRGLAPYPCAKTFLRNNDTELSLKIFEALPEKEHVSAEPGKIFSDGKKYIKIACSDGLINISSLQLEGKTRMSTAEFLRGFRIEEFHVPVI